MAAPEHVKVWNTWRGRAGMLLTASLRRAKGMAAWVRIAVVVIITAAAVLESLFAWWWVGSPGWLMIATAIALAPPLVYGAWWLWWRLPKWRIAVVIIAAAAVLELLFAIWWWVGLPGWLMIATAIAFAPPLVYGACCGGDCRSGSLKA